MADERASISRAVASAASLALSAGVVRACAPFNHMGWREVLLIALFAGPPAVAAALVWTRRLGAQLLARACWWCYLVVGVLALGVAGARAGIQPMIGVGCCAAALLAAGRSGLDGTTGRFQPVAFRSTLLLSLILAMADASSLTMFALGYLSDERLTLRAVELTLLAGATWLGVVGLLRLRTWGLLTALVANLAVGTLALTRVLAVPEGLQKLFVATAVVQVLVPLPMLVTLVRRRAPGPDTWQRWRSVGGGLAIVALTAFAIYAGTRHAPLFSFTW